jgi:hypothetical protein
MEVLTHMLGLPMDVIDLTLPDVIDLTLPDLTD